MELPEIPEGIKKYAVPVAVGGLILYVLMRSRPAQTAAMPTPATRPAGAAIPSNPYAATTPTPTGSTGTNPDQFTTQLGQQAQQWDFIYGPSQGGQSRYQIMATQTQQAQLDAAKAATAAKANEQQAQQQAQQAQKDRDADIFRNPTTIVTKGIPAVGKAVTDVLSSPFKGIRF